MKLKRSASEAALMQDGRWAYHAEHSPDDVDNSPEYFDEIVYDVIDPEKYVSAPVHAGIGTVFTLFLGNVRKKYHVANFRVDGLHTTVSESGVRTHKLFWTRTTDWDMQDMDRRVSERLSPRRGPGRPPKEEIAA